MTQYPARRVPALLSVLTLMLLAGCATTGAPQAGNSNAGNSDTRSTGTGSAAGGPGGISLDSQSLTPWLCADIQDQYVVAHQDDDLLFMNPDLSAAIRLKHCVLTTFLTAGNDNKQGADGLAYMLQRENGIRAAYARMAGVSNVWLEGSFVVNNKAVKTFVLRDNLRVVVSFFRLSDGADSDYSKTLAALNSSGDPAYTVRSIDGAGSYTKAQLIRTLADMMKVAQPKYLHLQDSNPEPSITFDNVSVGDHVDHVVGGRLVEAAEGQYTQPHMTIRYRDYNINAEHEPNLSAGEQASKLNIFNVYAAKDPVICPQATGCITPGSPSLYSFYGWTQRQYFHQADDQQGAVLTGRDGQIQAFVTGSRSSTIRTIRSGAAGWGSWQDLKGNFSAVPVVATYSDGRLAAFVHSNYGTMFYSAQNDDQSWGSWRELGGQGVSDAAATADASGLLRAVGVSNSGQIYEMSDPTSRGGWTGWQAITTPFYAAGNPALARDARQQLTLLALDSGGRLRVTTQPAGSRVWSPTWQLLGGSFASSPVVARAPDGRLEVFLRGTDQQLYRSAQTGSGSWGPLEVLAGVSVSGSPVVTSLAGSLTVAVRTTAGQLGVIQQTGAGWSSWNTLVAPATAYGSSLRAVIGLAATSDGQLEVLARADNEQIYHSLRRADVWGSWESLAN